MGNVLTVQASSRLCRLAPYSYRPQDEQPIDGSIFQLPARYRGMPKKLIPLYAKDSLGQDEKNLIRMSDDTGKIVRDFVTTPTKENLEALLYILLACENGGFYPWSNMKDFGEAVDGFLDCGWMAGTVRKVLENRGCKVATLWFVNGKKDAQYTTIIKTPCGKYFACDHAAWCYGPEDSPWFYVMEAKSVEDAIDKLKNYFHNIVRRNSNLNNKDWHLLDGVEQSVISWIEDRDRLLARAVNDCARLRS